MITIVSSRAERISRAREVYEKQEKTRKGSLIVAGKPSKRRVSSCQTDLIGWYRLLPANGILVIDKIDLIEKPEEFLRAFLQRKKDDIQIRILEPEMRIFTGSKSDAEIIKSWIIFQKNEEIFKEISEDKIRAMREDRVKGYTYEKISEKHLVSKSAVAKYCKQIKIPRRKFFLETSRLDIDVDAGIKKKSVLYSEYRSFSCSRKSEATAVAYASHFKKFMAFLTGKLGRAEKNW